MCVSEALIEKCKKWQAGNHLQQDVDFLVKNALKLAYEHLKIGKGFLGSLSLAMKDRGGPS
jgi:hypothetical protein